MHPIFGHFTEQARFFGHVDPYALVEKYGSPLYVYNESLLRQRCREMKQLVEYPRFHVSYSAKANANLALLRIVRAEGLRADAMSLGEMHVLLQAGAIDGLSIGYRTIRSEKAQSGQRLLHEIELWEVSLVTFPMLPEARVQADVSDAEADLARTLAESFREAREMLA